MEYYFIFFGLLLVLLPLLKDKMKPIVFWVITVLSFLGELISGFENISGNSGKMHALKNTLDSTLNVSKAANQQLAVISHQMDTIRTELPKFNLFIIDSSYHLESTITNNFHVKTMTGDVVERDKNVYNSPKK